MCFGGDPRSACSRRGSGGDRNQRVLHRSRRSRAISTASADADPPMDPKFFARWKGAAIGPDGDRPSVRVRGARGGRAAPEIGGRDQRHPAGSSDVVLADHILHGDGPLLLEGGFAVRMTGVAAGSSSARPGQRGGGGGKRTVPRWSIDKGRHRSYYPTTAGRWRLDRRLAEPVAQIAQIGQGKESPQIFLGRADPPGARLWPRHGDDGRA